MSRRPPPNPAAERAAKNLVTIKSLLKLEPNKICADCKKNKHPRWASWNLGVFICIRCSGIHRGMGTHISRVKSVDLDSWTDEQLASVLSWGNARANKYWEAKLAQGHTPSEAKIENFIRTKYELKRWVMDGPLPDPASLDVDGDDDVPLSIVKEKQAIDRKESMRKESLGQASAPQRFPQADLMGGDPIPRSSSAAPTSTKVPPKAEPAAPKTTNTKDSLLGLDFLGGQASPPPRPASTTGSGGMATQSRPDLKQSILSLYATAPRQQAQPQQPTHSHSGSFGGGFGGMQSPTSPSMAPSAQSSVGGMNDAFSSLSFSNISGPKSPQNSAFSQFGSMSSSRSTPQQQQQQQQPSAFSGLSGGGFFDSKPSAPASTPSYQPQPSSGGFGDFGGFGSPAAPAPAQPAASSSAMNDLFDFGSSAPQAPAKNPSPPAPSAASSSVFNLSQPKSPAPATTTPSIPLTSFGGNGFSGADVWGGNAWASSEPASQPAAPAPAPMSSSNDFGGWGSNSGSSSFANTAIVPGASGGMTTTPKVAADEEFGGWTSSTGAPSGGNKPSTGGKGFGGSEDLFSNVWE